MKNRMKSHMPSFLLSGGKLFKQAFVKTKRQMLTSVVILIVVTLVFASLMYLAEHLQNPSFSFWDAIKWNFVKYVGDPAEVTEPPVTVFGQIVGTLVGVLGIAIFAVPAGLIGSGLIDAMNDENRENELKELRERIRKAFLRDGNKVLRNYLKQHREKDTLHLADKDLFFVPQEIPVYKMQARQNMDMKDIIDCCKKFPEIRLKNVAQAKAEADARFVVEYVPLKIACYGCFIERQSRVTIVSTSSYAEKGTGWFAYYLAKMGGFNFLSKDLEVDYDDQDPYFNMNVTPLHDMKNEVWHQERNNHKAIEIIKKKEEYRKTFLKDLKSCCQGDNAWVIIIKHHLKNTADNHDFHFTCKGKDGKECTVNDQQAYDQFVADFAKMMEQEFHLTTTSSSNLYDLKHNERQKNLAYFIREDEPQVNVMVLRPASDVINLNEEKLVIAYRMAQLIRQRLDPGHGPLDEDLEDLQQMDFAFKERIKDEEE